jgi:serine/threonine protein kinase
MRQEEMIADRYRVLRPVGKGGMGTVWLGHDEKLRRDVALKRVGVLPGEDSVGAARAMREARLSAALHHENAVSIFDVVEHDGSTWLVMEYVPSQTLAALLAEEGRLPPERVAHIGAQVANALVMAHELGIVHRDVKPGNILVGADDVAKISDFGIARGDRDMQLTQTGLMTGTPGYFSPELARGSSPSPASDVWALGVTLYTAVEGDAPYPAQSNPLAMLSAITRDPVPPPRHAGPLTSALEGMLARDPEARWTMPVVAEALESYRRTGDPTRPLTAGAFGTSQDTSLGTGRETSSTVVAAAQPSYASPQPSAAHGSEQRTASSSRRMPLGRSMAVAAAVLLLLLLAAAGWAMVGDDSGSTASEDPAAGATDGGGSAGDGRQSPDDGGGSTPPEDEEAPEDDGQDNSGPSGQSGSGSSEDDGQGSQPPTSSDPEDFTREYFTTVPDDLDAGWRLIDPSMQQELGRESYDDFWGSVQSVRLLDVEAADEQSVRYEVVYVFEDGQQSHEVKELSLRPVGQSFRITGDTTVG